jgi:hypothetical protein
MTIKTGELSAEDRVRLFVKIAPFQYKATHLPSGAVVISNFSDEQAWKEHKRLACDLTEQQCQWMVHGWNMVRSNIWNYELIRNHPRKSQLTP